MITLKTKCLKKNDYLKRDWRFYSKSISCSKLGHVNFDASIYNVQECWNDIENKLILIIDELIPIRTHSNHFINQPHCLFIKHNSRMISFERIHQINNRATPEKIMMYRHWLALYRLYNHSKKPTLK